MSAAKIWRIEEPVLSKYAQCWLRSPLVLIGEACSKCGVGKKYAISVPLALEWEAGSSQVGDFTWPGGGRTAVSQPVVDLLTSRGWPVKAGSVEMVQDPKLKKPKNLRRSKPRVWLPYEGPPLMELLVDHRVHLRPETTIKVMSTCVKCGHQSRQVRGVEIKEHRWSQEIEDLVPHLEPRVPGQGVFVSRDEVGAAGLFRATEVVPGILCTDEVKAAIEGAKLTNIDFLEYGDVV